MQRFRTSANLLPPEAPSPTHWHRFGFCRPLGRSQEQLQREPASDGHDTGVSAPKNELGAVPSPNGRSRQTALDATRGLAMLLVCISHFGLYFRFAGSEASRWRAELIGLPASPTFVLLSGILLGLLCQQQPERRSSIAVRSTDRGLFLLLIGHIAIGTAHWPAFGNVRFVFMTDAIGVSLLLAPWLIFLLSRMARMGAGAFLLALNWYMYLIWQPTGEVERIIHDVAIGQAPTAGGWLTFPLLPWLGVYIFATGLGEQVARWQARGGSAAPLAAVACGSILLGVCLHALGRGQSQVLKQLLSCAQKYPPGPAYLLAWGGFGLLLLAGMERLHACPLFRVTGAALATLGRSALIVFILQYYVYFVGLWFLQPFHLVLWPLYLVASIALLFGLALLWESFFGNGFITVGLQALARPSGSSDTAPKPTRASAAGRHGPAMDLPPDVCWHTRARGRARGPQGRFADDLA